MFGCFFSFAFARAIRVRDARVRTLGRRGWRGSGFEPGYIILRNGKEEERSDLHGNQGPPSG